MTAFAIVLMLSAGPAPQAHPATCPVHNAHAQHTTATTAEDPHAAHAQMEARGAIAMGFDQSRATHRFTVLDTGGVIEITTNAKADHEVRAQIAAHLEDISHRFKAGDFSIPKATHLVMPPGAVEMAAVRDRIDYRFQAIPDGGRVTITTDDPNALAAVHAFLRYQIQEHRPH